MSSISIHTVHTPIPATSRCYAGHKAVLDLAAAITEACRAWRRRSGDPSRLYRLNDHVLEDIGLGRGDIGQGPTESLWRA